MEGVGISCCCLMYYDCFPNLSPSLRLSVSPSTALSLNLSLLSSPSKRFFAAFCVNAAHPGCLESIGGRAKSRSHSGG